MLRIKLVHHILFFLTLPLATIVTVAPITTAVAQQVTPDGTVSTTVTTPDGKNFNINDGTTRGGNLFHSFKEFSVPTGGSANFNNAANIQNIINRVTGGSVSNIDGLIKANGAANVFLFNPAGIIFGPNASLNIGGSFLGTTAHSFLFDNGFEFSATNPQAPPLLTINVPIGLGFRNNPGNIQVKGPGHGLGYDELSKAKDRNPFESNVTGLQVEPGKTLTLVGGNVSVEGGVLRSPGGRIEIGSFDSNQVVNLVPGQSEGFSLAYQGTPSFRDIQFSGQAFANVTGDGSGSIAIKGKNINFTNESILLADTLGQKNGGEISIVGNSIGFNRSRIFSNTFGSGNGGQIELYANNIKFENNSGVSIQTWDKGNAGNINMSANSLEIKGPDSSLVSLTTGNSTGKAGDINVTANGPMAIAFAGINTDSSGTGKAGTINMNANSLQIDTSRVTSSAGKKGQAGEINFNVADSLTTNKTTITTNTDGPGDAGNININTNSFQFKGVIQSEAGENSTGRGGVININAGSLEILKNPENNTLISTATKSKGNAGDINIDVKGPLTVAAPISTKSSGAGNAGTIKINANSLRMEGSEVTSSVTNTSTGQGGEINITADSLTSNGEGIKTNTEGTGDAGTINIKANSFQLKGEILSQAQQGSTGKGGEINITAGSLELPKNPDPKDYTLISTTTRGKGDAGNINITVTGPLTVDSGAQITQITTESSGNGKAGDLKISADTIKLNNSLLNANTRGGQGNITVKSRDLILRNNGKITTDAKGTVNGGNIEINNTGNLVVFEDSKITANAEKGYGGTVNITAQGIFRSKDSITATSEAGSQFNGTVQFNTPETDPTQGLFELTETVIDPAQQIALNPCVKGFGSTFTITGRGGLPSDPNKILSGDNVRVDLVEPVPSTVISTSTTEKKGSQQPTVKKIVPAQGWIYNEKGQVVLVAYDPTKTGPQRSSPAPTSSCAATR